MRRFAFFVLLALGLSASGAVADSTEPKPESDAAAIERLYARLKKTPFSDEAAGIIGEIDRANAHSGSDTGDLLMSRALKARASSQLPLALQLFDTVVDLYPAWSEGWSERATARFQSGDVNGAMADLAQTLKREPRDIGALGGLGAILLDAGQPESALSVYDRALALAPAYEPLKEARARAQTAVWSRSP